VTRTAAARAADARQKAEKREILRAAGGKKAGKPAKKRALPRPSAIVKDGALVRKSKGKAEPEGGRAKRQRKVGARSLIPYFFGLLYSYTL